MPMKRIVGLAFFALSWLLWVGVLATPWLDASPSLRVAAGGGLYGLSYAAFALSIALLGKEAWDRIKGRVAARLGWSQADPAAGSPSNSRS